MIFGNSFIILLYPLSRMIQHLIIDTEMSDYSSNSDDDQPAQRVPMDQREAFRYDYYLSNSSDVFEDWKEVWNNHGRGKAEEGSLKFLQAEIQRVRRVQKFRTAEVVRLRGFAFILKRSFELIQKEFAELFDPVAYKQNKQSSIARVHPESIKLEKKLWQLVKYLQMLSQLRMLDYLPNVQRQFQKPVALILSKLFTYISDPVLLWQMGCSQTQLVEQCFHEISLGGNEAYYKGVLRSMLKRNIKLKQIYDRCMQQLKTQSYESMQKSQFIAKMVLEVLSIQHGKSSQKQGKQFIDVMKGIYYLSIKYREKGVICSYLLTSFHLDVLSKSNMFKDYKELQDLFIALLENAKTDKQAVDYAFSIEMDKLIFEKRERVPKIEQLVIDHVCNYIGVVKGFLGEQKQFGHIKAIPYSQAFASTKTFLEQQNFNSLIGLMMCIQDGSKQAFSQGDLAVHKIYLEMSELIKEIYLSYQYQNWLFPANILLYIPLRYFMDVSDDIKSDVRRALFAMVEAMGQGKAPLKLEYQGGEVKKQKVGRAECLQVILYFLEECRQEEEYINLPELVPSDMQTSILYVKSLQSKLNHKEPTPDQMPYVLNMLKTCESYKLTIKFRWHQPKQSIEDRQIEFNIQKGLTEDWMRKVYREVINQRQSKQIKVYFQKYTNSKGLTILNLANIFKYCHGLMPGTQITRKSIREEDLFTLLEEIKMLLSINLDIFNLNFDEEISLNYVHVCLNLYNTCYDEGPFNQVYMMIMEKIMGPYLSGVDSSKLGFRERYPGFFQRWVYSFQMGQVFQQLGRFISQKGQDETCREDIVNKIKFVRGLIDNKENITKTMQVSDLTETIVIFSTLIGRQSHPLVYIESIQLFCLFLNSFPEVKKQASLQFMLDGQVLSNGDLVKQMVKYIKKIEGPFLKDEVSILGSLMHNLDGFMTGVGLKRTNEILEVYYGKVGNNYDDVLSSFQEKLYKVPQKGHQYMINLLRLVLTLKKQQQFQKRQQKFELLAKIKIIQQSLKNVNIENHQELKLCELIFIEDILPRIDKRFEDGDSVGNVIARKIFHDLIKKYGTNEDRIYFAQKLDLYDLILTNPKGQIDKREEEILIDLLLQSKGKGNEVELIKKILRESSKLSEVSSRAIEMLLKSSERIQAHHLNKFIHINNRYPSEKIQRFVLQNIGCERNHGAVKIKQSYLVKDLMKCLEKVPKNVCEELLLVQNGGENLVQTVSTIFEKLLYLPIGGFDEVNLKMVEQIHEQGQDWNTESEGEQTKPQRIKSKNEDQIDQQQKQYQKQDNQEMMPEPDDDQEDSQNGQGDRPPIVQMFTEQDRIKDLQLYGKFMLAREQFDVMIDSQYHKLKPGSQLLADKQVSGKILALVNILNSLEHQVIKQVVMGMPFELFQVMKAYGLNAEMTEEMKQSIKRRRKVVEKEPKWRVQLFSDREESDDSNVEGNSDDDSDEEEYQEESEEISIEDKNSQMSHEYPRKKPKYFQRMPSSSQKAKYFQQDISLPGLLPTYSKVEQEVSGSQLKRDQLVKILQISLYWLINLPQSQIRTRQITAYYMQILNSKLGKTFFESCVTVLRYDEGKNNLEWLMKQLRDKSKGSMVEVGLRGVSMQVAINNVLYILKEYQSQEDEKKANLLFSESGVLLSIAEKMITKFDLPIQNNCITLLFLYISSTKAKIRSKIQKLNYEIEGGELPQNSKEYKLKQSQMVRIIQAVCRYGNSSSVWQVIQGTMGLKVKDMVKLFGCLKGYGSYLYGKLTQTGQKILTTIKQSQSQFGIQHEQKVSLHNIQNTYHIVSKLVLSVKDRIKQFYFINKQNLKKIMEEQIDDLYEHMEWVKKLPKKLKQNKTKLLQNRELINLVQGVIYFIKILKDQFYGKVQDKMFNKLVQYPKMILEATWYYIFIYARKESYTWNTPSQIEQFFKEYPFIGGYKFKNLQEVFGLIIYFLNLEPFCTDRFKQFFVPILMRHRDLAREITLQFKVPKTGQDQQYNTQNILVTRKCSFDMAFYQLTGEAIQVQFFNEEGSDYGGLVRELLIGWKGKGVGEQDFFLGKILGISFKQGVPYGGSMDIAMFVAITNFEITMNFFQDFDPELYRSLVYIKENDPEPLCLKFVIERTINGRIREFELMEGGSKVDLVEANKHKYLELYMSKYFYLGREKELQEMKLGFNTVVYQKYAQIFTPFEMMRQIKGEQIIDVKMLISKAKYEGYSAESSVVKWLWQIVQTFNQDQMNTFIQFVTGSPKITIFNSNFSISIEKVYEVESLPVAHTCFNTIDLPEYSSKEILQKKLLMAIYEGNNSFGIL